MIPLHAATGTRVRFLPAILATTLLGTLSFGALVLLALGGDPSQASAVPIQLWLAPILPFAVAGIFTELCLMPLGDRVGPAALAGAVLLPGFLFLACVLEVPGHGQLLLAPVASLLACVVAWLATRGRILWPLGAARALRRT